MNLHCPHCPPKEDAEGWGCRAKVEADLLQAWLPAGLPHFWEETVVLLTLCTTGMMILSSVAEQTITYPWIQAFVLIYLLTG